MSVQHNSLVCLRNLLCWRGYYQSLIISNDDTNNWSIRLLKDSSIIIYFEEIQRRGWVGHVMLLLSGFRGWHDSFVFLKSIFYLAIAQSSVKAFTLVYLKFMSILAQEPIFSILHIHFSKTPTLDYLFYTLFYLNNHFLTFYIISLSYPFNIFEHTRTHSLSL